MNHDNDVQFLLDVWELFHDHVPEKQMAVLSERLLNVFEDFGYDVSSFELTGVDSHIDKAIQTKKEENDDEEFEDDSYEDEEY